jgi:hypothetical protein
VRVVDADLVDRRQEHAGLQKPVDIEIGECHRADPPTVMTPPW